MKFKMNKLFSIAALTLAATASAHAEDDWQKRKECAATAEKWEQTNVQEHGGTYANAHEHGGVYDGASYRHHYSPKYNRCYVEMRVWVHPHSPVDEGQEYIELSDVFESGLVALARTGSDGGVGSVAGKRRTRSDGSIDDSAWTPRTFEEASAFIDDHMNN
jgi:hypothetical protein